MEILVFTNKLNSRKQYCFKQVFNRILGIEVSFTSKIEAFISYEGMKFSYASKALGGELFVEANGLLDEQGFGDFEIKVDFWHDIPCFFKTSKDSSIPFDIFSASFYLLTRYEEYLPFVKDNAGGFPVEESTAFKENFLKRPVVDLWAYQFLEVLQLKYPKVNFKKRNPTTTFHIAVHEAFAFRYKGLLRQFAGFVNHLLSGNLTQVWYRIKTQLRLMEDPYNVYDDLVNFAQSHGLKIKVFFQLSDFSKDNRNINYHKTQYQRLIKSMGDYFDTGLLPGFHAIKDPAIFKKEKKRWKEIAKQDLTSVLIKKYPLAFPESYINFEKAFIKQDFSMGYQKKLGFRAGTCTSFLFYNLNSEETTSLKVIPYVMNSQLFKTIPVKEISHQMRSIKKDVLAVNGDLNLIFENRDFTAYANPEIRQLILDLHASN